MPSIRQLPCAGSAKPAKFDRRETKFFRKRNLRCGAALALLLCLAVAAATAASSAESASTSRTQLGIVGDPGRFTQLTGQRSSIRHVFASLYQSNSFPRILEQLRPVPLLALKTGGTPPLDLAQGRADSSLVALNSALAGFGGLVYVRPMP